MLLKNLVNDLEKLRFDSLTIHSPRDVPKIQMEWGLQINKNKLERSQMISDLPS